MPTFASVAAISPRTLHRVCLRTFGSAPKRLLRRQGFMNVLGQIRVKPYRPLDTHVGDEDFDPSNILRDFAIFAGVTTRTCLRAARVRKQKAAVARARARDLPVIPLAGAASWQSAIFFLTGRRTRLRCLLEMFRSSRAPHGSRSAVRGQGRQNANLAFYSAPNPRWSVQSAPTM